ncbi:MAG: hypothetical protein AAFN27_17685 [Pseudomonadota bacterium]
MRWLAVLVFLWPICGMAQHGIEPGDIRIELELEERPHAPHPGEMILLSIHGTYRIPVVREKLLQPELEGFDWMQLGEDRWYKAREDGFEVLKLERRMALFPQLPGRIEVPAFTHALEMLARNGRTVPVDVASNVVSVQVAPRAEDDTWWFPVRGIEISDNWSNQPETLDPGGAALRVITLIVEGTAPQRIPPLPELTGAGAYIFPHPEHRVVALGPNGPVSRVFWRWTVRPMEGSAGYVNPMMFSYFDAETRETVDIRLAAQRIAHKDGPQEIAVSSSAVGTDPDAKDSGWALPALPPLPGWAVPVAGVLGVVLGLGLALRGAEQGAWRLPARLRPDPIWWRLQRAVRQGDAGAVRTAAHAVIAGQGGVVPDALKRLDQAVYGNGSDAPDLRDVLRAVRSPSTDGG